MNAEPRRPDGASSPESVGPADVGPLGGGPTGPGDGVALTAELRRELLDLDAWGGILTTYGGTMRVAVALTDAHGQVLGRCYNPQPVWTMVHDAVPDAAASCPFCMEGPTPCTAVADAFRTGGVVMSRDQAGLTHVAVPLLLKNQQLGAIIAGQVFDRFPDPLLLRRVARDAGISEHDLWMLARKQHPVSAATLKASGDLLYALGQAFLQQRYSMILEATLAETNRQFRLMVEGIRDYAVFTIDLAGCVTSWNGGAARMLGYAEAEIVGRNYSCMFTPEDIRNHLPEDQLHGALLAERGEVEGTRLRSDRQAFLARVNITLLPAQAGGDPRFALIMEDVTERRRTEAALEEVRQERLRSQNKFLSHVSHELRTPLTAIYFFTTNLLDGLLGEVTPEQSEHLRLAVSNVNQLKNMVSDLIDIAQVEEHKLSVEPKQVNVVRLIADVLQTCETNAAAKKISLQSEVALDVPMIWADPARLRQILINLIDNGIKFTPEGGSLTISSRPVAENDGCLCLSVRDTGVGISEENQGMVFDRLAQVRPDDEPSRSGLGLGLFIARELVTRQGGRIWVESELGRGSTFFFTIPIFSMARLCAHVLTAANLAHGHVTLIMVEVQVADGAASLGVLADIRGALERSIRTGPDLLLPPMGDADPFSPHFILACTGAVGGQRIAARIRRELQQLTVGATLTARISTTTLAVAPDDALPSQTPAVAGLIDRLVRVHTLSGETLQ
ncbi:MAG: ATP-binding protein [Acidobacteriota bacterium]